MTVLIDIVKLCSDWPLMERSIGKYVIAAVVVPVLMTMFFNLPWILLCVCIWIFFRWFISRIRTTLANLLQFIPHVSSVRPSARLLTESHPHMSALRDVSAQVSAQPIPGGTGLPFIGETVSFIVSSRQFLINKQREYGRIFATAIDFSGTFLVARRVVCLANPLVTNNNTALTNPTTHPILPDLANHHNTNMTHSTAPYCIYTHPNLKYVAYSGLFGSSSPVNTYIPDLTNRILNNYSSLDRWEDIATPIIRGFLRRLVYEGSFSFADRVNELACELISSIFLNMTGLSVPLLTAMDTYLSTSHHNSSFNASLKYRKQISHFMHVAVFEEDRRFYARSWDSYDNIRNFRSGTTKGSGHTAQHYGTSTYQDDLSPEEVLASEQGMVLNDLLEVCAATLQQGRVRNATTLGANTTKATSTSTPSNIHHSRHNKHRKHSHTATPPTHLHGTYTPSTPHTTHTAANRADSDQHNLFFIFLVEVLYSTLVSQLRTLVQQIVSNHHHLPAKCRANYTQYLSARQLVGNVSGTGLNRLSWGSTIYEEEEDNMDNIDLQSVDSSESEEVKSEDVNPGQLNNVTNSTDTTISTHTSQTRNSRAFPSTTTVPSYTTTSSSIGSYLLSQMPWPLSPAPTPFREEHRKSTGTAGNTGGKVDSSVAVNDPTHSSTYRSSSDRADYSFPISSSSSTSESSSSSSTELRYSSSNSNHRHHTVNSITNPSGDIGNISAVLRTDAGVQYLDALQTPPADHYGRRIYSIGNTSTHTTSTQNIHTTTANVASLAPSTPISRASLPLPVSISNSSTTSNHSSTSNISSASKYTGKYGPRRTPGRTPGRAAYNIVTPARNTAASGATATARPSALSMGLNPKNKYSVTEGTTGGNNTLSAAVADRAGTTTATTSAPKSSVSHSSSVFSSTVYKPSSSNTNEKRRRKASKNSVRHRQKLIIKYITSVKRVVDEARQSTVPMPLPLQYSLHLCTQAYDVVLRDQLANNGFSLTAYTINRDDLVINIHPSPLTATTPSASPIDTGVSATHPTSSMNTTTNIAATMDATTHSPDSYHTAQSIPTHSSTTTDNSTAHKDLGIFSELVLSIFTHELTTGYLWEEPPPSLSATSASKSNNYNTSFGKVVHSGNSGSRGGALRIRTSSTHPIHTTNDHSAYHSHLHADTTEATLFNKAYTTVHSYTTPLYTLISNYSPFHITNINTNIHTNTSSINSTEDGVYTVPNHSVQVRKFRTSPENFAFLIGADSNVSDNNYSGSFGYRDNSGLYGVGSVEEDTRYYSDGL